MLAVVDREELEGRKYLGMNPAFVRKVWAKRRQMVRAKPVPQEPSAKTLRKIFEERAIARERETERLREEKLRRRMEAGGVQGIIAEVALAHGVSVADILGPRRFDQVVKARHQAIIEVAIRKPALSLTQIGKCFSRDHTTVLHVLHKHGIRSAA
jgi:hypothetical protein